LKDLLKTLEDLLKSIGKEEIKNPRVSAKTLELSRLISELKMTANHEQTENMIALKYISPKLLLEN